MQVLKRGRNARQPLELDLPERKILLKPDGTVDRVIVPDRLDAHKLIEEFMIQANVAAAETLEAKRQALVYRVHDAPSLAKQESLREFLATIGLSLARGAQMRPSQFNGILERVRGEDNEALVNEVVLRSQSQADLFAGESRPFRPQPAALRAFHLADPPLFRPDRAPRADRRARARQGRAHAKRGRAAGGDRRADLRNRAARHGGGARHGRPADRRLSRRAAQRAPSTPAFPASPSPGCLSNCRSTAPTALFLCHLSATTTIYSTKRPARCSANGPAKAFSLRTESRFAWSRSRRWQAPCASRC